MNFAKLLETPFSTEHLSVTASETSAIADVHAIGKKKVVINLYVYITQYY